MSSTTVSRPNQAGALVTVAIATAVIVGFCLYLASGSSATKVKFLDAAVTYEGGALVIANREQVDWRRCEASINDKFTLTLPLISAASQVRVSLLQFANDDGYRFVPGAMVIKTFRLLCYQAPDEGRFKIWG